MIAGAGAPAQNAGAMVAAAHAVVSKAASAHRVRGPANLPVRTATLRLQVLVDP
jgi:hypothetical protein